MSRRRLLKRPQENGFHEIEAVYGKLNQLSGITFCALQRRQQVFPCLDRVSISLSAQAYGQRNLYTHPYSVPSEPQGVYGLNSGYEFACSAGSEICMFHDFWGGLGYADI